MCSCIILLVNLRHKDLDREKVLVGEKVELMNPGLEHTE